MRLNCLKTPKTFDDDGPMSSTTNSEHVFNIILIGNPQVGKTTIVKRFTDDVFDANSQSTIGIDFKVKNVKIGFDNVKLQIWDTAGSERFGTLTRSYYRQSDAILLVFDVTNMRSFGSIPKWLEAINDNGNGDEIKILIGNKKDCPNRIMQPKNGHEYVMNKIVDVYVETSALDASNVQDLFKLVAAQLLHKKRYAFADDDLSSPFELIDEKTAKNTPSKRLQKPPRKNRTCCEN